MHRAEWQRGWSMRCGAALLVLWSAVHVGEAFAVDIDYDTRRSAALRRCDDSLHRGQMEAARSCYRPLLANGDALTRAEAAFALGDLRNANELFRAAVAAAPTRRAAARALGQDVPGCGPDGRCRAPVPGSDADR